MEQSYKVLVADDEIDCRDYIKRCFEKYSKFEWKGRKIEVLLCEDVEGVRELGPKADMLIVDILLPQTRDHEGPLPPPFGIDIVAELIENKKVKPDAPIIFISNYVYDTDTLYRQKLREKSIPEGRCTFMPKSAECDLLVEMARSALEKFAR